MPMPEKHRRRRLRAVLGEQQHWAIYPPAFADLLSLPEQTDDVDAAAITARLGMQMDGDSRMEIAGGVAYIPLTGILQPKANYMTRWYGGTATAQVEVDFRRALSDSQIKSIVLLVDSPGGSAMGNEEVAQTIFAARGTKPITAFVRGLAASAAYYVASAADRIVASPSSSIGSIGTILFHVDQSKMLEDWGIAVTPITHGEHKADGNPYQPLTKESRATLQQYVHAYGDQFVQAVARHRGVTAKEVMDRFGQGKVFLAPEALRLGMIDAVGTLESLQSVVAAEANEPVADSVNHLIPAWTATDQAAYEAGVKDVVAQSIADVSSFARAIAASAASVTLAATAAERNDDMTKRIKAALYALGLVSAADASDEVCQAALSGFFRGSVPDSEDKILHGLTHHESEPAAAASAATTTETAASTAAATNVQQAHDREIAEARSAAVAADRQRREQIEASGRLLQMTAEQIQTALASDQSHAAVIAAWHQTLAEQERPVQQVGAVREGADRFAVDAIDAMLLRVGYRAASAQPSADAQQLRGAPLSHIARQCLALRGVRVNDYAADEDIALQALQMCGLEVHSMSGVSAAGPSWNRPGDFPNLLSGLANRLLDQAIEIAEPTYPLWTARMADLPDFKPATIIGMGNFDELDELMDDEAIKDIHQHEELSGWIQIGRYGNKVGLTPIMIANDDLDGFSQALQTLAVAHERTLNRLCLALITGNVVLPDGVALYNLASHGNDVTSGGGPSTTQAAAMRLLHRRQTGIGGVGRVKTPPKIALVPSAWEEAAMQTFLTFQRLNESKLAVTDATINTFRGSIEPVVEPDLEDSSLTIWYTFCDPRIRRTIVHAFQRGYGQGGKRTTWFDQDRKSQVFDIEGRFAAAACGHRGTVRNAGA